MPTRQFALLVVLTAVLLVRAHTGVRAQIVTPGPTSYEFGFSGHVTGATDVARLFGDHLLDATTFTGSYTFTYPAQNIYPGNSGDNTFGFYLFQTPSSLEITVGDVQFLENPSDGGLLISAVHENPGNPDMYGLSAWHNQDTDPLGSDLIAPGWVPSGAYVTARFELVDPSKTAMPSADLPTAPPDLGRFSENGFELTNFPLFDIGNQFSYFQVVGHVDRIWVMNGPHTTDVPEPGPASLATACALALGSALLARRRRRTI